MKKLYNIVKNNISKINFNDLWLGFHTFDFALYNNEEVILNNESFPWDERFLGNTAIEFEGRYIGIWNIDDLYIDPNVLSSCIIHEMFHAFQYEQGETRFPNEINALINYKYDSWNLTIKHTENLTLIKLLDNFNTNDYKLFLKLRKYRKENFPIQYQYETKVEVIEGIAEFIELQALLKLSEEEYNKKIDIIKKRILDKGKMFPIRIISYDIGSIICLLTKQNNININHSIGNELNSISDILLETFINEGEKLNISIDQEIEKMNNEFVINNIDRIEYIKLNGIELTNYIGCKLGGLDPYNSRAVGNNIYCPGFLMVITRMKM